MASFKQTAITQGAILFIENVTGEAPYVNYTDTVNYITWKPGQAKKFADYLMQPSDIGVDIALAPLLPSIIIKKAGVYILAYTAAIFALTKYLGKK